LSQSRLKVRRDKERNLEVCMTLGEMRDNKQLGGDGMKRFLEFYSDEPDDRTVIVDMQTGAFRLEGMPEGKSQISSLVN